MNWPSSWQQSLHQTLWRLTEQQPAGSPPRVVILGIGHELRGDDGVGTAVAQKLLETGHLQSPVSNLSKSSICHELHELHEFEPVFREIRGEKSDQQNLLIIDGAHAPENQTGPIRRFGPQLVLLVDAAFVGQAPGAVELIAWQDTTGLSATTHTMPPYMLAQYLVAELGCEVALLGIQPGQLDVGAGLSAPVQQAVDVVVTGLQEMLGRFFACYDKKHYV